MRFIVEDGVNNIFTQFNFELLPFVGINRATDCPQNFRTADCSIMAETFNPDYPVKVYPVMFSI